MQNSDLEQQLFEINMRVCKEYRPSLFKLMEETADSGRYMIFPSRHESQAYNLLDTLEEKLYYELDDPSVLSRATSRPVLTNCRALWSV